MAISVTACINCILFIYVFTEAHFVAVEGFNTNGIPEQAFVEHLHEELSRPEITDSRHPHHVLYKEYQRNKLYYLDPSIMLEKGLLNSNNSKLNNTPQLSPQCFADLEVLAIGVPQFWGLQFLDAWGKPTPGLYQGSTKWTGAYGQCMDLSSPKFNQTLGNVTKEHEFIGRYCNVYFKSTSQKKINMNGLNADSIPGLSALGAIGLGACVPDTCSFVDLWILSATAFYELHAPLSVAYVDCQPTRDESPEFTSAAIGMISLLSFLGLLLVVGTAYDICIYQPKKHRATERLKEMQSQEDGPTDDPGLVAHNGQVHVDEYRPLDENQVAKVQLESQLNPNLVDKLFLSFSVNSNGSKVLNTGQVSEANLGAVHGIRFISMSWVILGHTLVFLQSTTGNFIRNIVIAEKLIKRFTFQAILGASVSVDSFFLLSGTLVAYLTLREMKKRNGPLKINWFLFYFHRFWRLTPAYMIVLGIFGALYTYFGSGPYWPMGHQPINCTWWTNLLYINNYVEPSKMCIGWSWFLANDMQFFIITPLFIVPLYFSGVAGSLVTLFVMTASIIATAVISGVHHYLPGIGGLLMAKVAQSPDFVNHTQTNSFNDLYIPAHTRIAPYLVGVLLGYILYKTDRRVKMPWFVAVIGWIIASVCLALPVYGLFGLYNGTHTISNAASAMFNATHRFIWAVGLAWVIFACVTGYGGFVNTLLSWKALVPLSRLTYMAYLVHPVVMFVYVSQLKQTIIFDDFTYIYLFLSNMVFSYMVAFVATLAFESPMMALEKVVFARFK